MSNYAAGPVIYIDDPESVTVGLSTGHQGDHIAISIGPLSRHGYLLVTQGAARDLADKLTAALVDAPGTSSPQREPGDAA